MEYEEYNTKERIGSAMAGTSLLTTMGISVVAGLTSGLTDNQELETMVRTAIVPTIASMPISYIGETISAKNCADDQMVGITGIASLIYSPILYGVGYGLGRLIKYMQ